MLRRALTGRKTRTAGIVAAVAASAILSACGGQTRQDAKEPRGTFPVQVTTASFPASQQLAQHTHLVIAVRNAGNRPIPDVAVTITDPARGTGVQAFAQYLNMPGLANHSRPVWVVDQGPGACKFSCQGGGAGGAVSAYSNTWALGTLKPGATAKFDWKLTAVAPGTHTIQYQVAAGLNGLSKAQLGGGGAPKGRFTITISQKPAQAYVDSSGKVLTGQ
jgi:hypothetical protein